MTRLVTVAHGTRHASGNEVAAALTAAAGRRLGVAAVASYVELCEPSFAEVVAASTEPTVAVPLLLSQGFHVRHDLPAARPGGPLVLTPPLGPHPLVAAAQVDRLLESGARPGQPVALVAAGSRDPSAMLDLTEAARLLAEAWRGPVSLATLTGPGPRPEDVLTRETTVSPYLLAEGHFAARCRATAPGRVAAVIGVHASLVELVGVRFAAGAGELPSTGSGRLRSGRAVAASGRRG